MGLCMCMGLRRLEEGTGSLELELQGCQSPCGGLEPNKRSKINLGAISFASQNICIHNKLRKVRGVDEKRKQERKAGRMVL